MRTSARLVRTSCAALIFALLASAVQASSFNTEIRETPDEARASAALGDPSSQFNLALRYREGRGVKKDPAEALAWLRKAAALGQPEAQHNLAVMLSSGDGVPRDEEAAVRWFRAAAGQGVFEAQRALIACYGRGIGVKKSAAQALAWDFLARRSLELRYEQPAGAPPLPPKLGADGFGEYLTPQGWRAIVGADGSVLPIDPPSAAPQRGPEPTAAVSNTVSRNAVSIAPQLAELDKIARGFGYYAGATEADYERGRSAASRFVLELTRAPQKAGGKTKTTALVAPEPARLQLLATDRSEFHPLGASGRGLIKGMAWKHAETEHFVVHFTQEADAKPVLRYLECAFLVVTDTLQIDTARSSRKSHVFIFPDTATWNRFTKALGMPPQIAGFAYKDELLLAAHDERAFYLKTLCHEAAHAIVARFYPGRQWPLWLNEGFAETMSARAIALARGHTPERYFSNPGPVAVKPVFDRVGYGFGDDPKTGADQVVAFYAQSEKCVRTLLERLPAQAFPRFANLALAGNAIPACLRAAYGSACEDSRQFEALVNAAP